MQPGKRGYRGQCGSLGGPVPRSTRGEHQGGKAWGTPSSPLNSSDTAGQQCENELQAWLGSMLEFPSKGTPPPRAQARPLTSDPASDHPLPGPPSSKPASLTAFLSQEFFLVSPHDEDQSISQDLIYGPRWAWKAMNFFSLSPKDCQ